VTKPTGIIILAEETEKGRGRTTRGRSVQTYENIFLPWIKVWQTERKLEKTYKKGKAGMVLGFV